VCRTFDIDRHQSSPGDSIDGDITFLTMELLEGETLTDFLLRCGRLTTGEALPLALQMIEALNAAHGVGIVHRDFKPSNVMMVTATGSSVGLRVVVTDFGLARAVLHDAHTAGQASSFATEPVGLMGTPVYMAPEQFERGEATAASDIYSFGLVMYEMVTGQRPFADPIRSAEAAKRIKQPAPSPKLLVPDLDPVWEAAIGKCLEIEPGKRFQSAQQVAEEIAPEGSVTTTRSPRLEHIRAGVPTARSPQRQSFWPKGIVAIVVLALAVSLSAVLFRHYKVRSDAKLAGGATVLLTEIQNSTGDTRFDGTTELIRHQLSQSPYFNLLDAGRIREVLTQMTKPPISPLDPPTAREVALRTGAPRVIFGVVSRVGDSYVLDIDIEQPDNNPRRSRAQWENHWTWDTSSASSDKEIPNAFLSAIRDGSDWIRSQVGESANDIAREDAPPEDVTTANWEALAEFAQAEKFRAARNNEATVVALRNSVQADPKFALGYARLGDVLVSLSQFTEGYRAYESALALGQQRLTRRERDRIRGIYASDAEDYAAAAAAFKDYTVYYPHDYLGWFYRAFPLMMLGRVDEAIACLKKAVEIDPAKMFAPAHIARYDLILGRFQDALSWIQHLRDTNHLSDADIIEGEYDFLQGRYKEAQERFTKLTESTDSSYQSYGYSFLARLFAETGQYQKALASLKSGIDVDLVAGDLGHQADKRLDRAYIYSKLLQTALCLQDANQSLALDPGLKRSRAVGSLLGQAYSEAKEGDRALFRSELEKIEVQIPPAGLEPIFGIVRAHIRGEVFLAQGNWRNSLSEFEKAARLESPVADKGYLARALLTAAKHEGDKAKAARKREDALAAYSVLASKPEQIWQWPLDYPPGFESDETFSFVKTASKLGKNDPELRAALISYLKTRVVADKGLREVEEAKRLQSSTSFTNSN
jgi:serine/threonine protein kinase/tetratricopeptide (TPR) repeat protein